MSDDAPAAGEAIPPAIELERLRLALAAEKRSADDQHAEAKRLRAALVRLVRNGHCTCEDHMTTTNGKCDHCYALGVLVGG